MRRLDQRKPLPLGRGGSHQWIIDDLTRTLVGRVLVEHISASERDASLSALVAHLRVRCALPGVRARYAAYPDGDGGLTQYPLDSDGFAMSFDPLVDEAAFWGCFNTHGVVVGHQVADHHAQSKARARMRDALRELSGGHCDIDKLDTWNKIPCDGAGAPFVSRGFFELYHDAMLAALRQSVRAYIHHVVLWGRAELWTTFDRLGLKLPGHAESGALPLHVDQNPRVHPGFRTLQGVLALDDCPLERGTFVAACGSRRDFHGYLDLLAGRPDYRGEFVELALGSALHARLAKHAQALPLRGGDLVSWDSRTTHTNTANLSASPRFVCYLSAGPARGADPTAVAARADAFASGLGSNVRDALMHASKKPRFTDAAAVAAIRQPEDLTLLGYLLYGQQDYAAR